jgi:hypothetical protein
MAVMYQHMNETVADENTDLRHCRWEDIWELWRLSVAVLRSLAAAAYLITIL